MSTLSDLDVIPISSALNGKKIDVIVTGSIGAVESVKFIRALRRLGAEVCPWVTPGALQFTTIDALAWASATPVRESFSGIETHIATKDAVIIAPASASFLGKIAAGLLDSPACALVHSYMGLGKPVLALPNMHKSLACAPFVDKNIKILKNWIHFLNPREEDEKLKFPEPNLLADEISHFLNKMAPKRKKILITMGSTRGYIDDVRYISNYSSGALGSKVSEELYRQGHKTYIVCATTQIKPRTFSALREISTNEELEQHCLDFVKKGVRDIGIFMASVLDFTPKNKHIGKLSSQQDKLIVEFKKYHKILEKVPTNIKFACKLEAQVDKNSAFEIGKKYIEALQLELILVNALTEVSSCKHLGYLLSSKDIERGNEPTEISGKDAIAQKLASYIETNLH